MSNPQDAIKTLISQMQPAQDDSGDTGNQPQDKSPDMSDVIVWEPVNAADDYDIRLEDGSIRPMSESALRAQVIQLRQAGMIDVGHALELSRRSRLGRNSR